MNLRSNRYFILGGCCLTVLVYAILFQVMAHTRLIEKVMTLTCSGGEFLLIVGFLVSRIVSYLVVPPLLLALIVYTLSSWKRSDSEDWSEEYGEGGSGHAGSTR